MAKVTESVVRRGGMSEGTGRRRAATPKAKYSNYFEAGHNAIEFLIDFGQCYESEKRETLHTRIVTSPFYARRLANVLEESLRNYEQEFGTIRDISLSGRVPEKTRPQ
jgi:hypothetical protein